MLLIEHVRVKINRSFMITLTGDHYDTGYHYGTGMPWLEWITFDHREELCGFCGGVLLKRIPRCSGLFLPFFIPPPPPPLLEPLDGRDDRVDLTINPSDILP